MWDLLALRSLGPGYHHVDISAFALGTHEPFAPIEDRGLGGMPPRNLDKTSSTCCPQLERKTTNSNAGEISFKRCLAQHSWVLRAAGPMRS